MNKENKERFKFILFVLVLGLFIGLSIYFDFHKMVSLNSIQMFIKKMGVFGPIIYMIIYTFTSIIFFPASLLSTSSGAVWGEYLGTIYTVIGATIAATFPFLIARYFGRSFAKKIMEKSNKVDVCDRVISKNGFISVLIMRLIPVFPWDIVNYASGLCGIKFKDYILATLIGTIPGSFTYNLIGSSLGKPFNKTKIIIIFVMAILMAIFAIIYKRKQTKKTS